MCACVMWESFLSLCLPPEGLPPSFEAPVAMTQQESQTCSSAAAEPPITTPPPRTPGSLPSFPSLGHPHGGPEARISDPIPKTGGKSPERAAGRTEGTASLAERRADVPGLGDPGDRAEPGSLAIRGQGWGGCGRWKQPAPPAALRLRVTPRPQIRHVASCHVTSEVLVSLPALVPEKPVRTVGTVNILLPPKVAATIRQLLKVPPSDPYLAWVAREGVTGFSELVPFAGLPPTSWVIGANSLVAPGPCALIWQVGMRSLRSRAGVRVQERRC